MILIKLKMENAGVIIHSPFSVQTIYGSDTTFTAQFPD